jgi:hypothetical protein
MSANPIYGPYTVPSTTYHQDLSATYGRTIRVNSTTNNPLTLTGSYANNAGFIVINTSSLSIVSANGTTFSAGDFHVSGQIHPIYNISLSYVSASNGGDITILYRN